MLEKIALIPDLHAPYHDKRAFRLVLRALDVFKPDITVTLGDFFDMYAVSSHTRNPGRVSRLQYELEQGKKCLAELRKRTDRAVFIAGNHEDRLQRYIYEKAPELFETVKLEEYLKLKENNWIYVPYRESYQVGKLWITHDTGRAGKHATSQSLDDFQDNVVIGHVHRLSYQVTGNAKGRPHVGASFGWLGDKLEAGSYMHRVKANRDWALGFGVGYHRKSTGVVYLQPVPIVNYTCVVDGQFFSA